jgi:SnoaL-like domain
MEEDINKATVQRFWEEAIGQGRLEVVDQIFDPAITFHAAGLLEDEISGRVEVSDVVEQIRFAFPDIHVTIEEMETTEYGDVLTRWKGTSTPREWWGVSNSRLSEGKIVEMWFATISHTADCTWTTMDLDDVVELVPEDEELRPGEEDYYTRKPKPPWCCIIHC